MGENEKVVQKYVKASAEIIKFEDTDVISTSGSFCMQGFDIPGCNMNVGV